MEDELKVTFNQTFDDLLLMDDTALCSCWFKHSVVMYCEDSSLTFLPLSTLSIKYRKKIHSPEVI